MAREAIFIGYRRDDTADVAGRIFDALETRFGRDRLFKDVDNIPPGADFGEYIKSILPRCRVALILIGPHWVEAKDASGRRRLDDPHDWVRIEIETALATAGLQIVPVLINGAQMPRADDLPTSLQPLLRRNAAVIRRDPDFREDLHKLSQALRASARTGMLDLANLGGDRKAASQERPPRVGLPRWVLPTGAVAAAVVALLVWSPWRATGSREFNDCNGANWCPSMVSIPEGDFTMGSPAPAAGSLDSSPPHGVHIRRYAVSKFEVTFDQWEACVRRGGCTSNPNPSDRDFGRGTHPVINVSWNDAQSYVQWLSRVTGQTYRLLSEAEWEYAARAGATTASTSGPSTARFNSPSTAVVGSYSPNAFGLYDMNGNVSEWVQDCWHSGYSGAPTDGSAWISADCAYRGLRGGSWDMVDEIGPDERFYQEPGMMGTSFGFRVARTL